MNKPDLILIGAGGHAKSCIDVLELHGGFHVVGLVGQSQERHIRVLGYPLLGTDDSLAQLAEKYRHALVSLGQIESPDGRIRLYDLAIRAGFTLPIIVSPHAHVSRHAIIGSGTIVMHGAIVNAGARIGRNCIINSMALIEHDALVDDHCHISTGAVLNGEVAVKSGTFVGSRTVVKEGCVIGARCVVGMGLAIRRALADNSRITGNT